MTAIAKDVADMIVKMYLQSGDAISGMSDVIVGCYELQVQVASDPDPSQPSSSACAVFTAFVTSEVDEILSHCRIGVTRKPK